MQLYCLTALTFIISIASSCHKAEDDGWMDSSCHNYNLTKYHSLSEGHRIFFFVVPYLA